MLHDVFLQTDASLELLRTLIADESFLLIVRITVAAKQVEGFK